jgi:phage-related protein (TIGR01555 family)
MNNYKNRNYYRKPYSPRNKYYIHNRPKRTISSSFNIEEARQKLDAFYNPKSGFGGTYDPITRLRYNTETPLDRPTIELLYKQDWSTRKIVEAIPDDCTRKWITLNIGEQELVKIVEEKIRKLSTIKKVKQAMYNGRMYGGGVLIVIAKDGSLSPEQPLNYDNLDTVTCLNVVDRWGLEIAKLYTNPFKENYGEPELYKINNTYSTEESIFNKKIHESRVIKFDGEYLPELLRRQNNEWHDSVLNQINTTLKQFGTAIQSGAVLFQDFISNVLKIPDLEEKLTSDEGRAKLDLRIQYAIANLSSLGIVLLGEDETYNKFQTPISGLSDLINIYIELLAGASKIPRSRFFGQSLGTLAGATETTRQYYDYCSAYQINNMREQIRKLIKILLNTKECTNGNEPDEWNFDFNSLWDETLKDKTMARKMQGQTDELYVNMKAITPTEIRKNRFRSSGYNLETHINPDNPDGEFLEVQQKVNNIK